jgi:hypothetical protein
MRVVAVRGVKDSARPYIRNVHPPFCVAVDIQGTCGAPSTYQLPFRIRGSNRLFHQEATRGVLLSWSDCRLPLGQPMENSSLYSGGDFVS